VSEAFHISPEGAIRHDRRYRCSLRQTGETDDPLTGVLLAGASQLLAQAVEAEVAAMLAEPDRWKTAASIAELVGPEIRLNVRDGGSEGRGPRIRFCRG